MGYANIQADSNFYRQSLNADGVKYVTGPYTSLYEDVFRAVTVTTDSVVSVTSYVGDSLSNQFLLAGTEIYGLFSSVTIHSGKAVLHLAGASYISEIINQYSATGIPLGFYEEGTQCLSQKISALLTQGLFDDASWVMVPSQYEEDWVRAFKPTSELGNLAFTRSSDATFTDSTGVVRRSPWNLVTYSEMFTDASWTKQEITISPNIAIAPNGTITADKAIPSTLTTAHQITSGTLLNSAQCAYSVYAKADGYNTITILDRATATNGATFNVLNGTIQQVLGSATASIIPIGNGWYRCIVSATATGMRIYVPTSASNFAGDGVSGVLLWGAQLVEGSEALPYFATTDRLNVPRLDYRNADGTLSTCPRLLLEPQRTNSIRNSSMVGAVAGSPGTLPTNWSQFFGNGLTRTVVGTGTENGLPYVDVRFNGTVTTTSTEIVTETSNAIAASSGQVWSTSAFFKIVTAPTPPNSYTLKSYYWNGGAYVNESNTSFTPTTTLARYSAAHTVTAGTITHISQSVRMNLTNGQTYDFTIRIAAPQMELGAYATTWVPTTTTAVTRIADAASKTGVSSLIGQTEGTVFLDLNYQAITGLSMFLSIRPNTTNKIEVYRDGTSIFGDIFGNGVNVVLSRISNPAGQYKIALAYKSGQTALYINGASVGTSSTAFSFSTSMADLFLNLRSGPTFVEQTFYNQAALFPVRLDNATLAALTTL